MSAIAACPLLGGNDCLGRKCAWFTENSGCAMLAVADNIQKLEYQLRKMT